MNTEVGFGVKHQVAVTTEIEKGFWFWKRKVPETTYDVFTTYYYKVWDVPAECTKIELPIYGSTQIINRIARPARIEVWMGNHGSWWNPKGDWDMEYTSEEEFLANEKIILAAGFIKE